MTERLRFGTAGLRAPVGDGPNRMNVGTVTLAARAIADWLPVPSTVVIGRDARHGSAEFADAAARALGSVGHRVERFENPVPTPVVAHRVGASDAAAGIVITASHNPAPDNGLKVYAADGSQILPAAAAEIEARMDSLSFDDQALTDANNVGTTLGPEATDAYLAAIGRDPAVIGLDIVHTAMHGVGADLFSRLLGSAGHRVHPVAAQVDPDPDFPTTSFPNPEEPGALDLAVALAEQRGAGATDLILANDPDADRLAVMVPGEDGWVRLTGDDIGVLLADHILRGVSSPCSVATTIVSSSLLSKIAAAHGARCETTLTGFKWLIAADVDPARPQVFAYEEALGYAVSPAVRDKDGLSAALVFAELAAAAKVEGRSVLDELDRLWAAHGVHRTGQVSIRWDGGDAMPKMAAMMSQLRLHPPTTIGGSAVVSIDDLLDQTSLPPSNVLVYHLDAGRVIVRPSGTEPKLKIYLESLGESRDDAESVLVSLCDAARPLVGAA